MKADVKSGGYDHRAAHAFETPKKMLHHLEIHPDKKGGAMVEHHHTSMLHPVERHVFGKMEGDKMTAHVMKHTKMMSVAEPEEVEDAEGGADAHPGFQG